ncbi:MAG: hypothetical protein RhofKO_11760 [Rhodothermales bacterium]
MRRLLNEALVLSLAGVQLGLEGLLLLAHCSECLLRFGEACQEALLRIPLACVLVRAVNSACSA